MRIVATTLAALILAGMGPAVATNDCDREPTDGAVCHEFDVGAPVPAPYADHYYIWLGWDACTPNPLTYDCMGRPAAGGSGVPTPIGPVTAGMFGVLYQESNGCGGLQRFKQACGALVEPDRMILV